MKHLQDTLLKIESATLKMSGDKLNQLQRNEFKAEIVAAMVNDLREVGLNVHLTKDGAIIHLENDSTDVFVALDGTIKNLDYDLQGAIDEYTESVQAKIDRENAARLKKELALRNKAAKK